MSNATRIVEKKGKLTFSRLFKSDFQKTGSKTLEVKQIITKESHYPSKKYNSDLQDELFSDSDFGAEETVFTSTETRVAWIPVPADKTEAQVKQLVLQLPATACIYKILSNYPILTDNQKSAISQSLKSIDEFADAQAIRYPNGHEQAGELILDSNDCVQYKRTFFSKTAQADQDERGNGNIYVSDALAEELEGAGVHFNQSI